MAKNNSMKSPLWKLSQNILVLQFAISLISAVIVTMVSSMLNEDVSGIGALLSGGVGIVLTCIMVYSGAWHAGERDFNLVKHQHIKQWNAKGLVAGFLAQLPGAILAILLLFIPYNPDTLNVLDVIYRVFYTPFVPFIFLQPDYVGLLRFVPLVFIPLFPLWGYWNGFRSIGLWKKIVYPNKTGKQSEDMRLR